MCNVSTDVVMSALIASGGIWSGPADAAGGDNNKGSSVGRASDSRSRGPGFETRTGHLLVGSDLT